MTKMTIDHILHFLRPEDVNLQVLGIQPAEEGGALALPAIAQQFSGVFEGRRYAGLRCEVIAAEAVFDGDGNEISPAVREAGIWLTIRAAVPLALPALVAVADIELASAAPQQPFVLWRNPAYPVEALAKRVWPLWSGSEIYAERLRNLTEADIVTV
jgi:hypothetical protein